MARFGNVAELATFLGKLDADYAEYAPALWQKGIRTPRQLANFSEPHYSACDVPEGHIDDIKARADTTGSAIVSRDVHEQTRSKRLADAMSRIDTPSSYAKSIERQAELATGKVFNCYRSSQRPIPLALLYPFFDTFFWNASDTADLQQRDTLFTLELCQKMQGFVGKESRRELDFGTLFRDYLQGILPATKIKHQIKGKSIIDIQLQVQIAKQWVTLIYIEVKHEAGHSGDAQQEGMAYHFQDVKEMGFMTKWHTLNPALLLTVVGPTVRAFGLCVDATLTGICEPLSQAMDMLIIPHIPDAITKLASLFHAMPDLVQALRAHYEEAAVETRKLIFMSPSKEQLPYPLWDPDKWTESCQLGARSHKLVYLARGPQQPLQLVKFTQQYGVEAHDAWARAGIVPELLAEPRQVAQRWQQISMEYLAPEKPDSSGWFTMRFLMQSVAKQAQHAPESLTLAPDHLPQMFERAKHLVRSAHKVIVSDSYAAHGDVRPDNIMVRVKDNAVMDLKLIDMDWAGVVGTARYPSLLNTKTIIWPQGVGPGQLLQQAHDLELLQLQVSPDTRYAEVSWRKMVTYSLELSDMDVDT
ncbi:hypothetical protein ABBQ32_002462 [Trebouxia sp. C0010 RCD-2024]